MIKKLSPYFPLIIICIAYILFAFITYKHYGITADEELEYKLGSNLINFFINKEAYYTNSILLQKPYLSYYYHLYPMILNLLNFSNFYEWFHLLNMLFALPIVIVSYLIFYHVYKNKYVATLAPLSILFMPAFLGSIPANPKDVPFAVAYFVGISLIWYMHTRKSANLWLVIVCGVVFGYTQSLRAIGYTLYIIYLFANAADFKNKIKEFSLIILIAHLFMFATYPFVHENFFNIFNLLTLSKAFTPWDNSIIFLGSFLSREERPWYYLLVYIFTTTPVYTLLTGIFSSIYIKTDKFVRYLFFILGINIALYLALQPVIYNGLRHFLYLLPIMGVLSAVFTYKTVTRYKYIFAAAVLYFVFLLGNMYQLHPFEYVYFNNISKVLIFKNNVESYLETDYWGASYKEATEQLLIYLDSNPVDTLPYVYACNVDYAVRYYSRYKFEIAASREEADYIICDYQNDLQLQNTGEVLATVSRNGMLLNVVRKTGK